MGECLNFLPTENRFCIRLQFCYLALLGFMQNWLASWDKCLHSLPAENRSYIHRQFCYLALLRLTQSWLASWGKHLHSLPTENWFCIHLPFCLRVCPAYRVLRCKTRGLYYRREVLLTVGLFELKLASKLGQVPEFLVYREQILHSLPDLPASLQCKLGSNSEGIA